MNHKYKKRKNARAGCLMCKSNKVNGANDTYAHAGFGKLRKLASAKLDEKDR